MNVEIGAEAAQFPEKEYIIGIFVAVYCGQYKDICCLPLLYSCKKCVLFIPFL